MEAPPGRRGDWLTPPPSPPGAHTPGRHDDRGMGTFNWPPAGTCTWPHTGTLPWPRTPVMREFAGGQRLAFPVSCCLPAAGVRFLDHPVPLGISAFLAVGLPGPDRK